MFANPKFWIMIIAGPLICLVPDLFFNLTKQVFYPSPIEKVLNEQKYIDPQYDSKDHFNKI